ncbi:MAG: hypothetical protein EX285_06895 [Thaumarchaeota archaeon]|nr:hypothetical protein [Nitrososphaerota archaeon]
MVGKTVIAGIIGCSVIAVVLLAAFYSYQEVRIVNVDVDITDIKIGTTGLLTGIMKLLTGDISGLFYAIEHIELRITTDIQNDGFLPLIIPNVPYKMYVNDIWVSDGQMTESLFIGGGETKKLIVDGFISTDSLRKILSSIINRGGIISIKVDFAPQVEWGEYKTPQIFIVQKDIDLFDEIKKKLR